MFLAKKPHYRGSRVKDYFVTITVRQDATLQGIVTHRLSQHSQRFRSFLELITLLHDKMDELGPPVSGVEMRTWPQTHFKLHQKGRETMEEKQGPKNEAKVGDSAFLVRILFRQNATWMGEIHWLNGEKKLYFRSLLEMLMLMQEALDISGIPPAEYRFRSWEGEEEAL